MKHPSPLEGYRYAEEKFGKMIRLLILTPGELHARLDKALQDWDRLKGAFPEEGEAKDLYLSIDNAIKEQSVRTMDADALTGIAEKLIDLDYSLIRLVARAD